MTYLSRRNRDDGRSAAYAEEWQRYLIQDAIAKASRHVRALNRRSDLDVNLDVLAGADAPISFRGRAG